MPSPTKCPKCGADRARKILWGLPSDEFLKSEKSKDYYLGGCIVSDNDPIWHCEACDWEWGGQSKGSYNKSEDED